MEVDDEKGVKNAYYKAMQSVARNIETLSSSCSYNTSFWKRLNSFLFDDIVHKPCLVHLGEFDGEFEAEAVMLHDCCVSTDVNCDHSLETRYHRYRCRGCDSKSRALTVCIENNEPSVFLSEEKMTLLGTYSPVVLVTEASFTAQQLCANCIEGIKEQCEQKQKLLRDSARRIRSATGLPRELVLLIHAKCFEPRQECFYCLPH